MLPLRLPSLVLLSNFLILCIMENDLHSYSVHQLRELLRGRGVDSSHCLEKGELIALAVRSTPAKGSQSFPSPEFLLSTSRPSQTVIVIILNSWRRLIHRSWHWTCSRNLVSHFFISVPSRFLIYLTFPRLSLSFFLSHDPHRTPSSYSSHCLIQQRLHDAHRYRQNGSVSQRLILCGWRWRWKGPPCFSFTLSILVDPLLRFSFS